MSKPRTLSPLDRLLDSAQNAVSTVAGDPRAERANPGDGTPDVVLDATERRQRRRGVLYRSVASARHAGRRCNSAATPPA